ncbi:hypothetical protein JCM8547_004326 [Rhodosporidiobolus lusitaniae]
MGKRTGADDKQSTAGAPALPQLDQPAKKHRKHSVAQLNQQYTKEGASGAQDERGGQDSGAAGGAARLQDVEMNEAQDDDTARARHKAEKAERKAARAAKRAAKAAGGGEAAPSAEAAPVVTAEEEKDEGEEDERTRKKARKEQKKAEKAAAKEKEQEKAVEQVAEPAPAPSAPIASTSASAPPAPSASKSDAFNAFSSFLDKNKDKKKKRSKEEKRASVSVQQQQHQHHEQHESYNGPTDPALAGLMEEFVQGHAVASTSTAAGQASHAAVGDIPVFGSPNFPFHSLHPHDIPVASTSSSSHALDIPVDPILLSHSSRPSTSTHLDVPDRVALTAQALARARQQDQKTPGGGEKDGKKTDKGKGRAKSGYEDEEFRLPIPPPLPSSSSSRKIKASSSTPAPKPSTSAAAGKKAPKKELTASGDFFEVLVTKWLPVKEIKKLAEEQGATYKQGKFSLAEDNLIRSTLSSFASDQGLSHSELVTLMTSKRADATSSSSGPSSSTFAAGAKLAGHTANDAWELVARALGDRSLLSVYNHVKRLFALEVPGVNSGPWSEEEDERLRRAVRELGNQWERVGEVVGTRGGGACRDRWVKQIGGESLGVGPGAEAKEGGGEGGKGKENKKAKKGSKKGKAKEKAFDEEEVPPGMGEGEEKGEAVPKTVERNKGKWSAEEEDELRKLHGEFGAQWVLISRKMGGKRTSTQCRTKWNDFLARRELAGGSSSSASTPAPFAGSSTGDNTGAAKDKWRWKQEHASTLVHEVANLHLAHESEIDWKTMITHADLVPHGPKNLRDRFRHLMEKARGEVRGKRLAERGEEGGEVGYADVIAHLLAQYPVPGVKVKRTYARSAAKRAAKLAAQNPSAHVSKETVESGDEDEGEGDDGGEERRREEERILRLEDVVVDPWAEFTRGLAGEGGQAV